MEKDYVVRAEGLTRDYRLPGEVISALKGVDLAVEPGEFVAVRGPSGAGKTTLLNILGLLDEPTAGRVLWAGRPAASGAGRDRLRRDFVGFVFQDFYLIPSLTARENVALAAAFGAREDDAGRLLDLVGLGGRVRHYPRELSGGEMQRVAVARALYGRPSLVLADEPTGNLDTRNGERIFGLLADVARRENVAVVAATHNPHLAARADRVVHLRAGEVVAEEVGVHA
ncbi:MAG: ABC transporter ATP-binding protein [Candidatus Zixiibacteriota bacterium]